MAARGTQKFQLFSVQRWLFFHLGEKSQTNASRHGLNSRGVGAFECCSKKPRADGETETRGLTWPHDLKNMGDDIPVKFKCFWRNVCDEMLKFFLLAVDRICCFLTLAVLTISKLFFLLHTIFFSNYTVHQRHSQRTHTQLWLMSNVANRMPESLVELFQKSYKNHSTPITKTMTFSGVK
jgi:hypothetical protein